MSSDCSARINSKTDLEGAWGQHEWQWIQMRTFPLDLWESEKYCL